MKQTIGKAFILFLISFSLIGCTSKEQRVLNDVQKHSGIKYLTDSKVLFAYTRISGFEDKAGPVYYVLDYSSSNKKEEFVSLYYLNKTRKDDEFEAAVDEFIEQKLIDAYYTFDDQYKLDFEKPYSYYKENETFIIYYQETSIAYFLYYLLIP